MMHILALDLGTVTGWAQCHDGQVISGTVRLRRRGERDGVQYLRWADWLDNVKFHGLDGVWYERVYRHIGTDAAHAYGGYKAILLAWACSHNIPCHGIGVQAIKKHITGRGQATKDQVIAAVRNIGYDPVDDNHADALALLHMATSVSCETWENQQTATRPQLAAVATI